MKRPFLLTCLVLTAVACGGPRVDTRTFALKHLNGGEAAEMLRPYVFTDRKEARGMISSGLTSVTVRETPDNLEKIARVLTEFDRPQPSVRLHFQIIGANGSSTSDPAIKDVEGALRKLFRFKGYRLLAEAVLGGMRGTDLQQTVFGEGGPYGITATIQDARGVGDSGSVRVAVKLWPQNGPPYLETMVTLGSGQTAVLGNAQLSAAGKTIILTVRPELVAQ